MSEFHCEIGTHELEFRRAGTSEIEKVPFDTDAVERYGDSLRTVIQDLFGRIEYWDRLSPKERQKKMRPLAEAGRDLLLAMDDEPDAQLLREILGDITKLSVGHRDRIPWEFLYLGDTNAPIEVENFLGARLVVGRWFAAQKTTRRSGRASHGKVLNFKSIFGIPANEFEVFLAQDMELTTAKSKLEKQVLEKHADSVQELKPLVNGAEDDAETVRQELQKSEALSHFNCHGLPAGTKGREVGLIYVTDKFEVAYPLAATAILPPHSIVVLNTCFGADLSAHRSRCIAAAFASSPGVTVVASYNKVDDGLACSWAEAFYEALFAGSSVSDSLITAKRKMLKKEQDPAILLYTIIGQFDAKLLKRTTKVNQRTIAA